MCYSKISPKNRDKEYVYISNLIGKTKMIYQ